MKTILRFCIFFLVCLLGSQAYGESGIGLSVELDSPIQIPAQQGGLFQVTLRITNYTGKSRELYPKFSLPYHWATVPKHLFPISLDQDETVVKSYAIEIDREAPKDRYELFFIVQDIENPALLSHESFYVLVDGVP